MSEKIIRSHEWQQDYCRYHQLAKLCNLLDAEGWSVHSVFPTPQYTNAGDDSRFIDDKIEKDVLLVLSWRAITPKQYEPPKPTNSGYR